MYVYVNVMIWLSVDPWSLAPIPASFSHYLSPSLFMSLFLCPDLIPFLIPRFCF